MCSFVPILKTGFHLQIWNSNTKKNMKLTAIIEQSNDGWLVGQFEEFPDVISQGKTLEELKSNLMDALQLLIQVNKEDTELAYKNKSVIREEIILKWKELFLLDTSKNIIVFYEEKAETTQYTGIWQIKSNQRLEGIENCLIYCVKRFVNILKYRKYKNNFIINAIKYLVIYEKSKNGYSAYVPGCTSAGADREEIEKNIIEAIKLHLEVMEDIVTPKQTLPPCP